MSKPLRQSRTDHWSRGQDREDALRHASPAGVRNFLLRRVASRRPGRGGARFPFGFPNEPIGNIPIWTFDPNHPDGLNQPGTIVGENCLGPDDVTQSLAIVNTTFGKALAFTQFASIRRSITNWLYRGNPRDVDSTRIRRCVSVVLVSAQQPASSLSRIAQRLWVERCARRSNGRFRAGLHKRIPTILPRRSR